MSLTPSMLAQIAGSTVFDGLILFSPARGRDIAALRGDFGC